MYTLLKKIIFYFKSFRLIIYKVRPQYKKFHIFDNLKKESIFIDLGANVGEVSSFINDVYGCQIYCFEAHPLAYKILRKRFINFKNIFTNNLAVVNDPKKKEIKLYYTRTFFHSKDVRNTIAASIYNYSKKFNEYSLIRTIQIKEILNKYKKIDCIKIDIEGAEYDILPLLIDNHLKIGRVICELHGKRENAEFEEKKIYINQLISEKKLNNWFFPWK